LIVVNRLLEGGFAESSVAGAGTNEATIVQSSVVGCPLLGDRCEPPRDVTNEAIPDPLSVVSGPLSGMRGEHTENAANDSGSQAGKPDLRQPEPPESHEDAVKRIRRTREEHVRKLNEQARKEAEQAMASRRARLHEQRKSGEKPKNRLTGQAKRGAASRKTEAAGLNADRLSNLVEAALGQHGNAHRNAYPPPD
jgi:hypothetical protein